MRKPTCNRCEKKYEPYALVLDDNPLSVASYLEEGDRCEKCRGKN